METVEMSAGQPNRGRETQPTPGAQDERAPDWDSLRDDLGDVAGAAVERGKGFIDSARVQAVGYVDERKKAVATALTDLAGTLRDSGRQFGDRPGVGTLFTVAADGLEGFAHSIEQQQLSDLYEDAEELFRRRPALAAGVSFAAGFLLSRVVKVSAEADAQPGSYAGSGTGSADRRVPARV